MEPVNLYKGAIFDLDGVLVDTARFHYAAWRQTAAQLGFDFTEADNERLKGVSRVRSLEILLEIGGVALPQAEFTRLAAEKNDKYVAMLSQLNENSLLPGARDLLVWLQANGIKTAIGSASKNTPFILQQLGITPLFNAIIDGNATQRAKPDPEVFNLGVQALGLQAGECVVFEDASAGIEAALAAGCGAIGVGTPENLPKAQLWVDNLGQVPHSIFKLDN